MGKVILSDAFLDSLIEAGLVPKNVTHVVIEAKWGELTTIDYRTIADDDSLKVITSSAVEARVVESEEAK